MRGEQVQGRLKVISKAMGGTATEATEPELLVKCRDPYCHVKVKFIERNS